MITGEMKSKVDRLLTTFWNNGISNPLCAIEQISYLLFIKRLDDLELAKSLGKPIFLPEQQHCRWSFFKNLANSEQMLQIVRDEVFPFIKNLGGITRENAYTRHMKDAVFLIFNSALLATNYVWFYDMQADGFSLDDKRQPVEDNDIPDLLGQWKQRFQEQTRSSKAFFVAREEIKENSYDLSIEIYKKIEYEKVEYESPKVILQKLRKLENEIREDLNDLEELLD